MKFKNFETGETFEIDPSVMRLSRLKKRLSFFADWKKLSEEIIGDTDTIMVTLTYKNVDDWRPRHVTEFIRKVRRFLGWQLLGYFWVAENRSGLRGNGKSGKLERRIPACPRHKRGKCWASILAKYKRVIYRLIHTTDNGKA